MLTLWLNTGHQMWLQQHHLQPERPVCGVHSMQGQRGGSGRLHSDLGTRPALSLVSHHHDRTALANLPALKDKSSASLILSATSALSAMITRLRSDHALSNRIVSVLLSMRSSHTVVCSTAKLAMKSATCGEHFSTCKFSVLGYFLIFLPQTCRF